MDKNILSFSKDFSWIILFSCIFFNLVQLGTSYLSSRELDSSNTVIRNTLRHLTYDNRTIDLVFILDRSTGVSAEVFYTEELRITQDILQYYTRIAEDYTRVAVITFGKDVTVDFNYITSQDGVVKCELSESSKDIQNLKYYDDSDRAHGTNIPGAMEKAKTILIDSERHLRLNHKQYLIMMTDLEWKNARQNGTGLAQDFYESNVEFLLIGVGRQLETEHIRPMLGPYAIERYSKPSQWKTILQEADNNLAGLLIIINQNFRPTSDKRLLA